jgi:hypothetical protein
VSVLFAGILGGSGEALASQSGSFDLLSLTESGVFDSGVNVGNDGMYMFTKAGNEILSANAMYYSSDNGTSFSAQTNDLGTLNNGMRWSGYLSGSSKWVRAGATGGSQQQYLAHSTNRENWTTVAIPTSTNVFGLAASETEVVIIGSDGGGPSVYWYTTNLTSFTKVVGFTGPIRFANGYFLTQPSASNIYRITSGDLGTVETFSINTSASAGLTSGSISNSPPIYDPINDRWVWVYVSVSLNKVKAQYSDDNGETWNVASDCNFSVSYPSVINDIASLSGGGFVAVGSRRYDLGNGYGIAYYSADGDTWKEIPDAGNFNGLLGLVAL